MVQSLAIVGQLLYKYNYPHRLQEEAMGIAYYS